MRGLLEREEPFEYADSGVKGRTAAWWRVAVPTTVGELFGEELCGEGVIWFLKICADAEDSAVDARFSFAVKIRAIVERLKDEALVDAVDHEAGLLAGGVETEVHQDDETVESGEIPLATAVPTAIGRLASEESGSPAVSGDARALCCDRRWRFIKKIAHDLPADGRVGIEKPSKVRGSRSVIV